MEKEFIPCELSVKLRELGFDEECIATFDEGKDFELQDFPQNYDTFPKHIIAAPLWQQAFDWFREKGFDNGVAIDGHKSYYFEIWYFETKSSCYSRGYINYKEARLACLLKLIELCEKN